ncbi:uncharacterized protein EI90DRAFT_2070672 [Cantharellus anzutake]|uniref:uncharacterized protein n=1 Tax=Cantharellus anzutake TaxID=1750568 RepID=UPI00190387CC|nr:uncharacterized protein EI90DRAFT_2070672 [Cantharellus anzutake]KAF8340493.1 hypothetical protein EI90DRAFT_2070672 [Cantharellus anzutake]
MTSTSQRLILPTWMSYATVTIPLQTGGYSVSLTIVQLPLTYYGPSIPLPTDGSWVWGGYSSPAPSASSPTPTSTEVSSSASFTTPTLPTTTVSSFTSPSVLSSSSISSAFSTFPTSLTTSESSTSEASSLALSSSAPPPSSTSSGSSRPSRFSGGKIGLIAGLVGGTVILLVLGMCCFVFWRRRRARRMIARSAGLGEDGHVGDEDWEFVTSATPEQAGASPDAHLSPRSPSFPVPSSPFARDSIAQSVESATIGVVTGTARRAVPTVTSTSRDSHSTDYGEELPFSVEARSGERSMYQTLALEDVGDLPAHPPSPPISTSPTSPVFGHDRAAERETLLDNGRNSNSENNGLYSTRSFRALVGVLESYFQGRNSGWLSTLSQRFSTRPPSERGSNGSSRKSAKSYSIPLSDHPSQTSEKSQYVPVAPENVPTHDSTDESPPTPMSEAFPSPPDTHGHVHAFFRMRQSRMGSPASSPYTGHSAADRPISGYSVGGSAASGQTIFHDAFEEPIPTTPEPHTQPQVLAQDSNNHLLVPHLKPIRPLSPLSSIQLPGSGSGSAIHRTYPPSPQIPTPERAPLDFDVLDEPAPLPSVVLQPPREGSVASMSSHSHSFSSSPLGYQMPPGLEDYSRLLLLNLSRDGGNGHSSNLVNLESEPPAAVGDWQRITSTGSVPRHNRGVTVEHNGAIGHFRRETLGQVSLNQDQPISFFDRILRRSCSTKPRAQNQPQYTTRMMLAPPPVIIRARVVTAAGGIILLCTLPLSQFNHPSPLGYLECPFHAPASLHSAQDHQVCMTWSRTDIDIESYVPSEPRASSGDVFVFVSFDRQWTFSSLLRCLLSLFSSLYDRFGCYLASFCCAGPYALL